MKHLKKLIKDKRVALIGSIPPTSFNPDDFDHVVRCNDWWSVDEGPGDILFHIGGSPKIKVTWLLSQDAMKDQLKLLCLYSEGVSSKALKLVAECIKLPVDEYNMQTSLLRPLRAWFEVRGTSPSTGLTACYAICQYKPKELFVTGANLYANEPDHVGWHRHNPIGHCHWYKQLVAEHEFLRLGEDLQEGIIYWENYESNNSE